MKFVVRKEQDYLRGLDALRPHLDGKPYTVTIEKFKRPRTKPQNAKLHAMIRDMALHCGYPEPQMKDIVKAEFAPMKTVKIGDREVAIPKGTSEMSVDEISDLMESLYAIGAEIGCVFTDT